MPVLVSSLTFAIKNEFFWVCTFKNILCILSSQLKTSLFSFKNSIKMRSHLCLIKVQWVNIVFFEISHGFYGSGPIDLSNRLSKWKQVDLITNFLECLWLLKLMVLKNLFSKNNVFFWIFAKYNHIAGNKKSHSLFYELRKSFQYCFINQIMFIWRWYF